MYRLIKKRLFCVKFCVCCLICLCFCNTFANNNVPSLKLINRIDNAALYKSGKINIVSLYGNYHEMGKQYGFLLKVQLKSFYKDIIN